MCEKGFEMVAHRMKMRRSRFPEAPQESLDLLEKMLKFAPTERIVVDKALDHELFKARFIALHRPPVGITFSRTSATGKWRRWRPAA